MGKNECHLEPFSVRDQDKKGGWVAMLDDGSRELERMHDDGRLREYFAMDLYRKENRKNFAEIDGWSTAMLKNFEKKVSTKEPTKMMTSLKKIRSNFTTTNAVNSMSAVEGKQRSVAIISFTLGAVVGKNAGMMVEGSLHEKFKTLPAKLGKAYIMQMKDKLREGSQITLADTSTKRGTIHYKVIIATDFSNPRKLVDDMRAERKNISNSKRESVRNDPLSYAGKIISRFMLGITANKMDKKKKDIDANFGEVYTVPKGEIMAETVEDVYEQFTPTALLQDETYLSYLRNPFLEESERAIGKLLPGGPFNCNMHTLVREPFNHDKGSDPSIYNFTGKTANHYKLVPKLFYLFCAAKKSVTLNEIAGSEEVVKILIYLLHFHFGPNLFDMKCLNTSNVFGPVFNSNESSSSKITDTNNEIYGATVMLTAMTTGLISHSLTSTSIKKAKSNSGSMHS